MGFNTDLSTKSSGRGLAPLGSPYLTCQNLPLMGEAGGSAVGTCQLRKCDSQPTQPSYPDMLDPGFREGSLV